MHINLWMSCRTVRTHGYKSFEISKGTESRTVRTDHFHLRTRVGRKQNFIKRYGGDASVASVVFTRRGIVEKEFGLWR